MQFFKSIRKFFNLISERLNCEAKNRGCGFLRDKTRKRSNYEMIVFLRERLRVLVRREIIFSIIGIEMMLVSRIKFWNWYSDGFNIVE